MFSNSNKVTAVCVAMMMMMMMMMMTTEAAAMPKAGGHSKHSARTHRKSSDGAVVETVPLQLDPSALVVSRSIRPLQNASISPWTYNISRDDSLFPPVLAEARCLLRGCLDSEGRENLNLESRPIMHQVLLLRRVKSTGAGSEAGHSYHYRLETRLIAVGCTCIRPVVKHQVVKHQD
ncbi:interleukin-17F-like [Anoplopoma fimbria]|uniref:interleukin-17F-like n=1 Tax=Anoplopoma fimbria TaxID=229290 RepID=UPI0023EC0C49|nr:interleukin-17F-like [Anoplopoma fimbria]